MVLEYFKVVMRWLLFAVHSLISFIVLSFSLYIPIIFLAQAHIFGQRKNIFLQHLIKNVCKVMMRWLLPVYVVHTLISLLWHFWPHHLLGMTCPRPFCFKIAAVGCDLGLTWADLQYFTHENAFSQVNAVARFWPQFSAKLWNRCPAWAQKVLE